ncbi:hypothetical protein JKP88DRAFT_278070 [Tribonema minus]|uniref:LysM domain-containing protein n=1 Tax=Tribonema minus TaxID=303371 RepID=A0A835YVY3_9STRA|nr:hypothetical protein JKP88DRAFT_278070 [Tribonema minus]
MTFNKTKPTRKPTPKPTAAAGANRCGATSADAADTCGRLCPSGVDGECPPAQKCYRSITCSSTVRRGGKRISSRHLGACCSIKSLVVQRGVGNGGYGEVKRAAAWGAPISALSSCRYKGCTYYTVVAGDYLFKIAQLRGTTVDTLAALNPWLAQQGLNVIAPGQQVLVEACAAAGLPAKGRPNPELVAVAQLFTSAAIDPLVAKYTTAATAANQKALSDALHKNWATATGRGKLLQLQQSDSTFAALMSAYGTDRAATCARFRQQGAMASTLADCYCDAAQPQLHCDAKIKAAFEAGPGAKLKRKLEEEPEGPGMSFAREGERRAKKARAARRREQSATRGSSDSMELSGPALPLLTSLSVLLIFALVAVAWQQRSAGQSERSLALVDVGPPSTAEPQPPDLCTTGVSALTSGAGVDGFLSNVARRGGCLTPVSCSKTVLLWGFPFTASLSLSACVPYVAYANVNGYKTMQVCAQSGQCSSALTTTPSEQVAGLVGMNAGFTMSLCFGWAEAAAALKFFGVGACVSISIKLFPVKGWVVIAAEVLIIVVGFALNFYVQAFDEAKDYFNSLYGICSPANCKANLYCQMRQGDVNGNFEIKVTFLFWQKTLWSSPNFFTPRGCPSQPALPPSNAEFKVMSVYTTDWAQYRGVVTAEYPRPPWCAQYAYTPSNLDPALFTHINYAFAKVPPGLWFEFGDTHINYAFAKMRGGGEHLALRSLR